MGCSLYFWIFGLLSFLLGALGAWLWLKNRISSLIEQSSKDANKIINLENEYASLRTSSQQKIMDLEEEKLALGVIQTTEESNKEYEKLKVKYDGLLSEFRDLERKKTKQSDEKEKKSKSKLGKLAGLQLENERLKKELKKGTSSKNDSSKEKVKSLELEIKKLKTKLKKQEKPKSIERRIEIVKSIRKKKLKDWLSRDKSYKVKKKVSTSTIKE